MGIIALSKDLRERGLGGALMETAIDKARALGATRIHAQVYNTKSNEFYEHCGFKKAKQSDLTIPAESRYDPKYCWYWYKDI